jgi:hypothetical protein
MHQHAIGIEEQCFVALDEFIDGCRRNGLHVGLDSMSQRLSLSRLKLWVLLFGIFSGSTLRGWQAKLSTLVKDAKEGALAGFAFLACPESIRGLVNNSSGPLATE